MLIRQVMEMFDLLDKPSAGGAEVKAFLESRGAKNVQIEKITGDEGSTDSIVIRISGTKGRSSGGSVPTLGIVGRLGGLGARPEITGFVSDGDGALAVLSAALKMVEMAENGDKLAGDVVVATHICPDAPTQEHYPVPFMGSPVDMEQSNKAEVLPEMEAVISIDTTKGNEIINVNGMAMSPTVKEGYILPVSYDLLQIMKRVTGTKPAVFALSTQDITPYANDLPHVNSILQPATATDAPVVGLAITTEVPVAGCATGASHFTSIEAAARFAVETAKDYSNGLCSFYDEDNFSKLTGLYGSMTHLKDAPGK